MTTILALDLGTKCGWAIGNTAGVRIASGTRVEKAGRYDGGGMRYLRFRKALDELHQLQPFDVVYFEEVRRHASTDSAHVYGGLLATLTAWCEERGIPYEGVPVGTIKKDATGKGNAGKQDMIVAMNKRWGLSLDIGKMTGSGAKQVFKSADDNEADALALLHSALCHEPAPAPTARRRFSG